MIRPLFWFFAGCLTVSLCALPLHHTAAAAESVDATLDAARQAAHDNRNTVAAKLFAQAIAAAPERRLELLPDLSDQLTYSGSAARAVPLYREVLASHRANADVERHVRLNLALALSWSHHLPESLAAYDSVLAKDPNDIDALLGHARVVSWQDQLSPSLREYERILATHPDNKEALENIARVQNWRGRRRDAQNRARALLAKDKGNLSAAMTLAQSELWMGRPDIAARYGNSILELHPGDSGAKSLADDVADTHRGRMQISENVATQSDGLLIRNQTIETEGRTTDGLTSFGVRYQPITYIGSAQGSGSAIERKIGPFVRSRLNDWSEINATVFTDDISATGYANHHLTMYDTYLTLWPNDTFRFDIGSRRETFDNLNSLGQGITAIGTTISMDATPDENTRLTLRANVGNFSDGNRRAFQQVEVERSVLRQPRLSFGLRGTGYTFKSQLYNGYFDPARYRSLEVTSHIFGNINSRLYYDVAGSYGREWVLNGGTRPSHTAHGALSYVLSRNLSATATYDNFDTRQLISNSGFARSVLGFRLQSQW